MTIEYILVDVRLKFHRKINAVHIRFQCIDDFQEKGDTMMMFVRCCNISMKCENWYTQEHCMNE